MEETEIRYTLGELDGCRLIEVVYPRNVDLAKLSLATATYLTFWEVDVPTVQLNDVSIAEPFDDARAKVLISLLRRNATRPNYWASAYLTGGNKRIEGQIRAVLAEAGRSAECVFAARKDALAYLRGIVRAARDDRG